MAVDGLSPAQELFATARADGKSVKEATATAGCAERTGERWSTDPAIIARIKAIQLPAVDNVRRLAKANSERAIKRLVECIEPGYNLGNSADTNIRAALAVLKFAEAEPATRTELSSDPERPVTVVRKEYVSTPRPA
jgi:hypothetical protein